MKSNKICEEIRAAMIFSQMDMAFRKEALVHVFKEGNLAPLLKKWEIEKCPALAKVLEKFSPEAEIERAVSGRTDLITLTDPRYPEFLAHIDDAPLILYLRGQAELLQSASFAIVGARHASFYGAEQARRFARVLSDAGLTIVSGMARGIDEAAHESALQGSGRTIAVLGCGVDVIYPRENQSLYEKILERGAVISEYPLGAEPRAYHFPRRNRILSGLSLGVLVVEAHERSGSLITAYQALEQGREIFALPGPVHHITSRGTHRLIREGAALVESPEEILEVFSENLRQEEMFPIEPEVFVEKTAASHVLSQTLELNSCAQQKILDLIQSQSRDYETLLELSEMLPRDFAQALTELEIEGKVRKNLSGYYESA